MVAVKSHQAEAFMKAPDEKYSALLFFGTDPGLVMERAAQAAKSWAQIGEPEGEMIRIDDNDLENNPDRLLVELDTMPMFGGRKVVRVAMGRRLNSALLKPIVSSGSLQSILIVEGGNLKPADGLRKVFEASAHAAAVACYPDESKDLASIVSEVLNGSQLSISRDVLDALVARLGADRVLSRAEVEKLALYCRGKSSVEIEDVEAVVGDACELTVERVVQAAAAGESALAMKEFNRYSASGENVQAVVISLQRYFDRLHRVRCDLDAGRPLVESMRVLRPPVHFKQRNAFSAQCRFWSQDGLSRAMRAIGSCVKATRQTGAMDAILIERLLLSVAQIGRQSRGR